jgi:molybdopterin synthase catalytic subunit
MRVVVRVQAEPFDPVLAEAELRRDDPGIGAVVSFLGALRDTHDSDRVLAMTLEHYPGMTEKALQAIVAEAGQRWPLRAVTLIHRVGELAPGDPIVLVAVASTHRREAFRACEFVIDYLKTRAPLWKKERTLQGEHWVVAQAGDHQAEERWRGEPTE